MDFIAAVNRGGYRPTGREINQWRLQPEQKPLRKGKLLEPEIPAEPDRCVRKRKKNATGISALVDSMLSHSKSPMRLRVSTPTRWPARSRA